jgi:hypothetical protein
MRHLGRWLVTSVVTFHILGCGGDSNPPGMPADTSAPSQADTDRLKNQFMKGNVPKRETAPKG